ncbi:hypothetical protein ACE4RR_10560 [Alteribacillus sp. HJP-4]
MSNNNRLKMPATEIFADGFRNIADEIEYSADDFRKIAHEFNNSAHDYHQSADQTKIFADKTHEQNKACLVSFQQ